MEKGINALIVGVGSFGLNYARILSQLNSKKLPDIPIIDKLILTRTKLSSALAVADFIRNANHCNVKEVIAAEVADTRQLNAVLKMHHPLFIAIAARDRKVGDTIHADYTAYALKYGAVLCEKPFSQASGDGHSLQCFGNLRKYDNADFFGLELPFSVVAKEIMKKDDLRQMFMDARHLEFYWEARDRGENTIINDLALHPWSLIPRNFKTTICKVNRQENSAVLILDLYNVQAGKHLTCKVILKTGAGFRGLKIDDHTFGLKTEAALIKLIKLNQSLENTAEAGKDAMYGAVLLTVDNPLQQHIIAALRHQPIVGLGQAYESQLFLEILHGYQAK